MNKKISFLILILLLISCTGVKSDKEIINEIIIKVKDEINKGNTYALENVISKKYSDQYNRTKQEIINIVKNYLQTYSGLKVNVEDIRITMKKNNSADVEISVYFTVSSSSILKKLMRKYTNKYRFFIEFKKTNKNWKVIYSEYEYSGI